MVNLPEMKNNLEMTPQMLDDTYSFIVEKPASVGAKMAIKGLE
jgi:hypothetical protein